METRAELFYGDVHQALVAGVVIDRDGGKPTDLPAVPPGAVATGEHGRAIEDPRNATAKLPDGKVDEGTKVNPGDSVHPEMALDVGSVHEHFSLSLPQILEVLAFPPNARSRDFHDLRQTVWHLDHGFAPFRRCLPPDLFFPLRFTCASTKTTLLWLKKEECQ
jgi:hypothetical protein